MSFALFNRIRPRADVPITEKDEKNDTEAISATGNAVNEKYSVSDSDSGDFTAGAQDGVKKIEAITSVWTKNMLILAYVVFVL